MKIFRNLCSRRKSRARGTEVFLLLLESNRNRCGLLRQRREGTQESKWARKLEKLWDPRP